MRMHLPENGQERTRTFFAFLPVRIGLEIRWWETVTVKERYWREMYADGWFRVAFIDDATPTPPPDEK